MWGIVDSSMKDSVQTLTTFPDSYFNAVVVLPVTFEQLRTTSAGQGLRNLVEHLSMECSHPAIVNALL